MERRNFLKLACAGPFLGLIPKSKAAESPCSVLTLEKILEVKRSLDEERLVLNRPFTSSLISTDGSKGLIVDGYRSDNAFVCTSYTLVDSEENIHFANGTYAIFSNRDELDTWMRVELYTKSGSLITETMI